LNFFPSPAKRGVQIDVDPKRIGLRYPIEVGLVGDSKRTLEKLAPLLKRKEDRAFLKKAQDGMREWWKLMEERGTRADKPMKPQVVAWELGKRLAQDAIVSADSGTITTWFARQIRAKRGQKFSLSGNLATMANGLPYTIAAQIAYPERQCVGFVGDGGFSVLMAEFSTAVKYHLPIKIIIVKNNTLGQIKWEQIVFLGNPEYGWDLLPIDFAAFCPRLRRHRLHHRRSRRLRTRARRSVGNAWTRYRGGRGRSINAPDARQSHFRAGNEVCRIVGAGRTQSYEDCMDRSFGRSA
jgi:pyruvate dehydrogenase (quinone)